VLPKARSNAYETVKQAEAYKAETVAQAESDTAVFKAVVRAVPGRAGIHPPQASHRDAGKRASNSGRIVIADNSSDVVKILDLDETGAVTETTAAALEGGVEE
jgi:regulator of protease activity HflC (stomatin/prohibitin superfamily)